MFNHLHSFQNESIDLCVILPNACLGASVTDHLEAVINIAASVIRWVNVAFNVKLSGQKATVAAFPNHFCDELVIASSLLGQIVPTHFGVFPNVIAGWRIRQSQN